MWLNAGIHWFFHYLNFIIGVRCRDMCYLPLGSDSGGFGYSYGTEYDCPLNQRNTPTVQESEAIGEMGLVADACVPGDTAVCGSSVDRACRLTVNCGSK
ncbi:hypothetical protein V6N11_021633 [Hibiscus sabdariffa]|uniref:Uncharacterized protein n=1 Tax=Hibiscus sabdariffa TaxID=183260 RepID=A0ABR2PBH1_9ROSI